MQESKNNPLNSEYITYASEYMLDMKNNEWNFKEMKDVKFDKEEYFEVYNLYKDFYNKYIFTSNTK